MTTTGTSAGVRFVVGVDGSASCGGRIGVGSALGLALGDIVPADMRLICVVVSFDRAIGVAANM